MKIVATSNFDDESYSESIVAENIKLKPIADIMCKALNDKNLTNGLMVINVNVSLA